MYIGVSINEVFKINENQTLDKKFTGIITISL